MRFSANDDELSATVELDAEPADLTQDQLGEALLDILQDALQRGANTQTAPDGSRWAPLKPATIGQKGHALVGLRTGEMVQDLGRGERDITPRSATWTYPAGDTFGRAHGFHNGRTSARGGGYFQEPRPLVGWSADARDLCRALIEGTQPE